MSRCLMPVVAGEFENLAGFRGPASLPARTATTVRVFLFGATVFVVWQASQQSFRQPSLATMRKRGHRCAEKKPNQIGPCNHRESLWRPAGEGMERERATNAHKWAERPHQHQATIPAKGRNGGQTPRMQSESEPTDHASIKARCSRTVGAPLCSPPSQRRGSKQERTRR